MKKLKLVYYYFQEFLNQIFCKHQWQPLFDYEGNIIQNDGKILCSCDKCMKHELKKIQTIEKYQKFQNQLFKNNEFQVQKSIDIEDNKETVNDYSSMEIK